MPLPALLGPVLRGAIGLAPQIIGGLERGLGADGPTRAVVRKALGLGGRRRRAGLTATEMGKITFMAQTLGKRNPAVTLIVMKALGGKL